MNIKKTTTIYLGMSELIAALKDANPDSLDLQRLPDTGKGVTVEATGSGPVVLKFSADQPAGW